MIKYKITDDIKTINAIYFGKLVINKIMYGTKVIWQKITSCFGSGIWNKNYKWSATDKWKSHANN